MIEVFYFDDMMTVIRRVMAPGGEAEYRDAIQKTAAKFVLITFRAPDGSFLKAHRNFQRGKNNLLEHLTSA